MKIVRSLPSIFGYVLALLVAANCVSAQNMPPNGSFGLLVSSSYLNPTSSNGWAMLGVINFDGAGNAGGSYMTEFAGGPPQVFTASGTFTGTYTSNPDGTGSVTVTLDSGFALTFAMVITDGGRGLQLAVTSCAGNGCDLSGIVIAGFARAAYTGGSPDGAYGLQLSIRPNVNETLGVASFDSAGNVTLSSTFVGSGKGQGPVTQAPIVTEMQTGTYSMNADGSGKFSLSPQEYAFVMVDGGSAALVLQLHRSGNGVQFGVARVQTPPNPTPPDQGAARR